MRSLSASSIGARKLGFFVGEQFLLLLAFCGPALAVSGTHLPRQLLFVEGALATLAIQVGFYLADLYDFKVAFLDAPQATRLFRALGLVTIIAGLGTLLIPASPGKLAAVVGLGSACTMASLWRSALPLLNERVALLPRVLIVGEGKLADFLFREINRDGQADVAGQVPEDTGTLLQEVNRTKADVIVLATDDRRGIDIRALLACRLAGLEVMTPATFGERILKKIPIEWLHPSDLVFSAGFPRSAWLEFGRRTVSLLSVLLLSILACPILLVSAVLIKLDSRGPVFYSQERVGLNGRIFRMLKFRTMTADAERSGQAEWASKNDPRVTRVGRLLRRFRIDELPQILNVLKGEMGLVGPRPERPSFVASLRKRIPYYELRSMVPPGITGWAQIRYPYAASWEEAKEKLQYDLFYVKHLSLTFDLVILFHTARVVLFGRGAR